MRFGRDDLPGMSVDGDIATAALGMISPVAYELTLAMTEQRDEEATA